MENNDKEIVLIPQFLDAVIMARSSIKTFLQPRIRKVYGTGLSYEMFQVLNVLWRKNEVNQQEIANAVQKGKASLTPLIDKLVQCNLITRREDTIDRRNKIISLTEEGRLYERKFESMSKEFYKLCKGDATDFEISHTTRLLLQISNNLK